jgi:hypothetical protein
MCAALDLNVVINVFSAASAPTALAGRHCVKLTQQWVRLDIVAALKGQVQ